MIKDAVREGVRAVVADFAGSVEQGPSGEAFGEAKPSYEDEEDTLQVAGAMEGVRKSIEEDDGLF